MSSTQTFSTNTCAHINRRFSQWRIEWKCLGQEEMEKIKNALRRDHIDDPLYILKSKVSLFLQSEDRYEIKEKKGWTLVEFWCAADKRDDIEAWVRALYNHVWDKDPEELVFNA